MNNTEKIKLALGEPLKKTIGGQELEFYPLDVTSMPDFFDLSAKISGKDETEILKKENAELLVNLIMKMLKQSMKDVSEELLGQFAMKHFMELQQILVELHSPDIDKLSDKQISKIEQLKARINKNVKPTGENQAESSS